MVQKKKVGGREERGGRGWGREGGGEEKSKREKIMMEGLSWEKGLTELLLSLLAEFL